MKTKNNSLIITIVGAATLLIAVVGATFAYFSANSTSNAQTITTSNLNLTVATTGSTHITDIKPTAWSETMETNTNNADIAKIPFSVTSNATAAGSYSIKLGTTTAITLNTTDANGDLTGGAIADIKYRVYNGAGVQVGTEGSFSAAMGTAANYVEVATGSLSSTLSDTYTLYVYINDSGADQNQLQGLDFTVELVGSAAQA